MKYTLMELKTTSPICDFCRLLLNTANKARISSTVLHVRKVGAELVVNGAGNSTETSLVLLSNNYGTYSDFFSFPFLLKKI